jgi:chromosome segregation ATPase
MVAEDRAIRAKLADQSKKCRKLCETHARKLAEGAAQDEIDRVRMDIEQTQEELKKLAMRIEDFEAGCQTVRRAVEALRDSWRGPKTS